MTNLKHWGHVPDLKHAARTAACSAEYCTRRQYCSARMHEQSHTAPKLCSCVVCHSVASWSNDCFLAVYKSPGKRNLQAAQGKGSNYPKESSRTLPDSRITPCLSALGDQPLGHTYTGEQEVTFSKDRQAEHTNPAGLPGCVYTTSCRSHRSSAKLFFFFFFRPVPDN